MEDVIKRNNAIDRIRDITKEGKLIPFVGAGFSANIQGYPTWSQSVDRVVTSARRSAKQPHRNARSVRCAHGCGAPSADIGLWRT